MPAPADGLVTRIGGGFEALAVAEDEDGAVGERTVAGDRRRSCWRSSDMIGFIVDTASFFANTTFFFVKTASLPCCFVDMPSLFVITASDLPPSAFAVALTAMPLLPVVVVVALGRLLVLPLLAVGGPLTTRRSSVMPPLPVVVLD